MKKLCKVCGLEMTALYFHLSCSMIETMDYIEKSFDVTDIKFKDRRMFYNLFTGKTHCWCSKKMGFWRSLFHKHTWFNPSRY